MTNDKNLFEILCGLNPSERELISINFKQVSAEVLACMRDKDEDFETWVQGVQCVRQGKSF